MSHRKVSAEQEAEFVSLYESGMTVRKLAEHYGMTVRACRLTIDRLGVPRRWFSRPSTDPELRANAARLYAEGVSQQKIGDLFGVSQIIISRILRQEGVDARGKLSRGHEHGKWRGGRYVMNGYVQVAVHPKAPFASMTNNQGYVGEHRLVMAQSLGRPLTQLETVHHINGDSTDNRIENLQLRQSRHGKGVVMQCLDCGSHNVESVRIADAHN